MEKAAEMDVKRPRRASLTPRATAPSPQPRRRSFDNLLEKAKREQRREEVQVTTPGAKANATVRFAPEEQGLFV